MTTTDSLALIDGARAALERARTLPDIGAVREVAERARRYASAAKLGRAAENHAALLRLEAERKAGALLAEGPKNPGVRHSGGNTVLPPEDKPRLSDLGVTKKQSSDWQRMAMVPDEVFAAHVTDAVATDRPLTTAGVVQVAREIERDLVMDAIERDPDADDELREAQRRASVKRAYATTVLATQRGFMTLDPCLSVEVLDRDERNDLRRFLGGFRDRLTAWDDALTRTGTLRAVAVHREEGV